MTISNEILALIWGVIVLILITFDKPGV